MNERPRFAAGENIAMKIPSHEFERTVKFYRDAIGLPVISWNPDSVVLEFGDKQLWLDRIEHFSQAEIWLELKTDDAEAARRHLVEEGAATPDSIEPLPGQNNAFWVSSPCNIIHLVSEEQ
jgi:catechol 2,3-dioxygenase-like lactoylglutathione lyase family enzyme